MDPRFLLFAALVGVLSFADDGQAQTACELPPAYDSTLRPDSDGPSPISLGLNIVAIDAVYDNAQSFRADFFIRVQWTDGRLAGLASAHGVKRCRFALSEIWNPSLTLFNRRDFGWQMENPVSVDDSGRADMLRRFQGSLRSPLELRDFPLDRQRLPISLVSLEYSPNEVRLALNDESAARDPRTELPGWRALGSEHTFGRLDIVTPTSPTGEGHARFDYTIEIEREFGYYLWRAIAPLTFIVLMSWAVFWIEPENAGIQIALASTSILTLIAFLFSLNSILPPISYLTRMDFFLFGSLMLVFIAFAESIVTAILVKKGRSALAQTMDRYARVLFSAAFLLTHAVVWTVG